MLRKILNRHHDAYHAWYTCIASVAVDDKIDYLHNKLYVTAYSFRSLGDLRISICKNMILTRNKNFQSTFS